jgi:hypothetical protein
MSISWTELWQTLRVDDPQQDSGLQVFGLRWQPDTTLRYLTLDEGMAAGSLDVDEISEAGSVPTLKVTNRADLMTFLMAGEQLKGAKQNRVLNVSVMVPGRSEITIPVSCVEAGRWSNRPAKFASGGSMSHGMLRKQMSRDSHRGYQSGGTPTSDQGKVWREVARKLHAMGSYSPSQEFDQVYQDHQSRLDLLLDRFAAPTDCQGAAFAIGGRVVGADLFDQAATLSKLWPKLIRAYALDALEQKPAESTALVDGPDLKKWIDAVVLAPLEKFQSPGAGQDLRFESPELAGSALVVDDQPVHVELFAGTSSP